MTTLRITATLAGLSAWFTATADRCVVFGMSNLPAAAADATPRGHPAADRALQRGNAAQAVETLTRAGFFVVREEQR